jgi:hypothetical protein
LLDCCGGCLCWLCRREIYAGYDSLLDILAGYAGYACWLALLSMLPAWL